MWKNCFLCYNCMCQLFQQVLSQFKSVNQYDKFIKDVEKDYDIKTYRLTGFTIQQAKTIFYQINQKYTNKLFTIEPRKWHENQRRIYVWFIIAFMRLKILDPISFVDGNQKYWTAISQTCWKKQVNFLKYQLHNIIKIKGRVTWKPIQDALLKQIYSQFQPGQWNQVAKQFYMKFRGQYFKTPKQCRQRWQNHLNDKLKKSNWSNDEDYVLFNYVKNKGKKWAAISSLLKHSRTQHMIKNRYKSQTLKVMNEQQISEQDEAVNKILKRLQKTTVQKVKQWQEEEQQIQFVQSEQLIQENEQKVNRRQEMKQEDIFQIKSLHKNITTQTISRRDNLFNKSSIQINQSLFGRPGNYLNPQNSFFASQYSKSIRCIPRVNYFNLHNSGFGIDNTIPLYQSRLFLNSQLLQPKEEVGKSKAISALGVSGISYLQRNDRYDFTKSINFQTNQSTTYKKQQA